MNRPASVMTDRNSLAMEDENEIRPFSAMNSRTEVFAPTPIVVHRVENSSKRNQIEQTRKSVLEKEETTEILARWKKEHDEREKREGNFSSH